MTFQQQKDDLEQTIVSKIQELIPQSDILCQSMKTAMETTYMIEKNFLGTGRRLKLGFTTSGEDTNFTIGLTEPYFMERDLSGSVDIFNVSIFGGDREQAVQHCIGIHTKQFYAFSVFHFAYKK